MSTTTLAAPPVADPALSVRRLNLMRVGYAFVGLGLAVVKWSLFLDGVDTLPHHEGVVTCLLTAASGERCR